MSDLSSPRMADAAALALRPGHGAEAQRGRPWGAASTALWGFVIYLAFLLGEVLGAVLELAWWMAARSDPEDWPVSLEEAVGALEWGAEAVTAGTFASLALESSVILLAIALVRGSPAEYLALRLPRWRDLLLGAAATFTVVGGSAILFALLGVPSTPDWFDEAQRSAAQGGFLTLFILAAVVAAPVAEELVFRGFLFRGWAASRLGPPGAILLTSAIWAAQHGQHNGPALVGIFASGLVLGWLRHRSGSTLLTILLHALVNLAACTEAVLMDTPA